MHDGLIQLVNIPQAMDTGKQEPEVHSLERYHSIHKKSPDLSCLLKRVFSGPL